jgi:hypothetical protein
VGVLLTTCPITGQPIETGIESDALSMERTPQFRAHIPCPHCEQSHYFCKQDFFVCEMVDGVIRYMRAA